MTEEITLVKPKEIVIPGQEIAQGMGFIPSGGVYREGDKIISNVIGISTVNGRVVRVIPLSGKYLPKSGDTVIGKVIDMNIANWFIDIGCANDAALNIRETPEFIELGTDLSQFFNFGEYLVAKIAKVTRNTIDLSVKGPGLRKLPTSKMVRINPSKVPRVIGKEGSMISLIKDKTKCRIMVGQNGFASIQGEPLDEIKAAEAIKYIEANSHKEGLTEEVSKYLDSLYKGEKK
ncbi:MAG TPA: exosome complex RNA-binding protein Rrp4 [Candidatus Nanoarchaeia archaeon]|nr:exosome complex RNA-binding protein Rrp4 [Candidatus Nanoarchaeia archaeon]